MSVLQDTLLKVSSAIIVSVNDLLGHREKKTSPDYKALVPRLTDSIALIGHVHKELSFKRRDVIRPFLNQEFKQTCSRTLKPGKLLFGEDLPKTLRELKATNKIMNKVTRSNNKESNSQKNHYSSPFRSTQFRGNQSRKPFLGSKGGNAYPPQSKSTAESLPTQEEFHKELDVIKTKVNLFQEHIDSYLIPYLRAKVTFFRGGQLSLYLHKWKKLTSDVNILQTIVGNCIEFVSLPPDQ